MKKSALAAGLKAAAGHQSQLASSHGSAGSRESQGRTGNGTDRRPLFAGSAPRFVARSGRAKEHRQETSSNF